MTVKNYFEKVRRFEFFFTSIDQPAMRIQNWMQPENSEIFELGIIFVTTETILIQIHKGFALNNGIKEEVYFTCRRTQVG